MDFALAYRKCKKEKRCSKLLAVWAFMIAEIREKGYENRKKRYASRTFNLPAGSILLTKGVKKKIPYSGQLLNKLLSKLDDKLLLCRDVEPGGNTFISLPESSFDYEQQEALRVERKQKKQEKQDMEEEKERREARKSTANKTKERILEDYPERAYWLAKLLKTKIERNNPRRPTPNDLRNWTEQINKLNRLGTFNARNQGYSWGEIKEMINKSQKDDFWKKNILSAESLRRQAPKLEDQLLDDKTKEPSEAKKPPWA